MSIFKKAALAILPAFCLCLGGVVAVQGVSADTPETGSIVADGGFDKGDLGLWTSGWEGTGTSQGWDEADVAGSSTSGSVKVCNETRGNQHVAQKVSLTKGQMYSFKAAIKTENVVASGNGVGAFLSVGMTTDGNEGIVGYYDYAGGQIGTNDWFEFSTSFTASQTAEYYIRIRMWGSSGAMWADNVSLTPIEEPEIGLADGKFVSEGFTSLFWNAGWQNTGSEHGFSTQSHTDDGSGSFRISHPVGKCTSSYAATKVYLIENAKYKVSGWIKTEDLNITSSNDNVGAYFAFDEKYKFLFGAVKTYGDTDWTYYESYFTAVATGTHKLECKIWGATGTAYFDDINVEMVERIDSEVLKHWTDAVEYPMDDNGFTLVGIGDTQMYVGQYPDRCLALFDWLVSKKDEYNIRYAMHLGDVVDVETDASQWDTIVEAHQKLQDAGLKYAVVPGNHDYAGLVGLSGGTYVERDLTTYDSRFPKSKYDEWLGDENFGTYDDSMANSWHIFEAEGHKYLIIALEYGPRDEVLVWAKGLADAHPDHHVIVTTHSYVDADANRSDSAKEHLKDANGGDEMWEKFIRKCPNIFMVVNGHFTGYGVSTSVAYGDAGNSIIQMKVDGQDILGNGETLVALYRITNGTDVSVYYYSAYQDKYYAGSSFKLAPAAVTADGVVEKVEGYVGNLLGFEPLDGTTPVYNCVSSDRNVAKVYADGTVLACGVGEATITYEIDGKQSIYATSGVVTKYTVTLRVLPVAIVSIAGTFNEGNPLTVEALDSLTADGLKEYLQITATYNDGIVGGVREYSVSLKDGEALKAGENILTVTAEGFTCEVTASIALKAAEPQASGSENVSEAEASGCGNTVAVGAVVGLLVLAGGLQMKKRKEDQI